MWRDPIVEELHRIREEHAAKFNYDPEAIAQDWRRIEQEMKKEGWKFSSLKPTKPKPRKGKSAKPVTKKSAA